MKMCLMGPAQSGKTSILSKYKNGSAPAHNYTPTIGIDFQMQKIISNGMLVKIQLWDISQSAKDFNKGSFIKTSIKLVRCLFMVYDATRAEQLEEIR